MVVADGAAGGEGVAQPEAVLGGDPVGDVGEGGRALVGGDDEVGVVAVVPDDARRRLDCAAVDEVVGDVEQAADERLVALDALGEPRLAVRRRVRQVLADEAALGAGGDDDRVLHRLRLDQAEDLGAEVLLPVAPAQAAAGDVPEAQVHALDPRGVHEDLVAAAAAAGRSGTARGSSLKDRYGFGSAVLAALEAVRADRGLDQGEERPQDPVVVQARHGVEGGVDLLEQGVGELARAPCRGPRP